MKFKLHDIRESKVWKEAHDDGVEEGVEKGVVTERKSTIQKCIAKGMAHKEIADLLQIPIVEVRRLAKNHPPGKRFGMSRIEAIYRNSVFEPLEAVNLPEEQRVHLRIEPADKETLEAWLEHAANFGKQSTCDRVFFPRARQELQTIGCAIDRVARPKGQYGGQRQLGQLVARWERQALLAQANRPSETTAALRTRRVLSRKRN